MNDQRRGGGTHGIGIERRLAMQQDMLAAFGKHALQHDDLDAVLEEACRFVAEGCRSASSRCCRWSRRGAAPAPRRRRL